MARFGMDDAWWQGNNRMAELFSLHASKVTIRQQRAKAISDCKPHHESAKLALDEVATAQLDIKLQDRLRVLKNKKNREFQQRANSAMRSKALAGFFSIDGENEQLLNAIDVDRALADKTTPKNKQQQKVGGNKIQRQNEQRKKIMQRVLMSLTTFPHCHLAYDADGNKLEINDMEVHKGKPMREITKVEGAVPSTTRKLPPKYSGKGLGWKDPLQAWRDNGEPARSVRAKTALEREREDRFHSKGYVAAPRDNPRPRLVNESQAGAELWNTHLFDALREFELTLTDDDHHHDDGRAQGGREPSLFGVKKSSWLAPTMTSPMSTKKYEESKEKVLRHYVNKEEERMRLLFDVDDDGVDDDGVADDGRDEEGRVYYSRQRVDVEDEEDREHQEEANRYIEEHLLQRKRDEERDLGIQLDHDRDDAQVDFIETGAVGKTKFGGRSIHLATRDSNRRPVTAAMYSNHAPSPPVRPKTAGITSSKSMVDEGTSTFGSPRPQTARSTKATTTTTTTTAAVAPTPPSSAKRTRPVSAAAARWYGKKHLWVDP